MFNFETALATWRSQHKYSRAFKAGDLDELEQHIQDQVDLLVSTGMTPEEAFRNAIAELGSALETESEYQRVAWMKTRDRRETLKELRYFASMLANYARVAFRNLKKNRVSSIINIAGLAVSISVVLVCYLYASSRLQRDFAHENGKEIFLVHQITVDEDGEQWWGFTPRPLGPAIKDQLADVVAVARVAARSSSIVIGDQELRTQIRFVDPEFLDMFTFPLHSGTKAALGQRAQVILSDESAERFFGERDPVGETLSIKISDGETADITVVGVAQPFPASADLRFELLMGYDSQSIFGAPKGEDWSENTMATFLQVGRAEDAPRVERQLDAYRDLINAQSEDWQISSLALDNLRRLAYHRDKVRDTIAGGLSIMPIIVLSLISSLLLLLSCFNYMNITIATSTRRLKEIGVRKVVGGSRKQLIFQFLAENLELCAFALILGLFLAWQFTVPAFNRLTDFNLEISLLRDAQLWIFLGFVALSTGLLSGAYPAFYVSAFRPTVIFRGRERLGRKRPLTAAFLTFQFMLTFLTLLCGIVFVMNDRYHLGRDLGYSTEHKLIFRADNQAELNVIREAAMRHPGVLQIGASAQAIGRSESGRLATANGIEDTIILFGTDREYLDVMDVPLKEGHLFSDSLFQVGSESAIVNETFVRAFDLENPIGAFFSVDSLSYSISGILSDFHYDDFFTSILPAAFVLAADSTFQYLSMRVQPGSGISTAEEITDAYATAFPGRESRHYFQDETFDDFYRESKSISTIFSFVATIALLISCLSIYALSAQNVVNRLKEIGVRKVLGGSSATIAQLVNRRLIYILSVAAVLATPLGYFALDPLLDDIYAYRMDLTIVPFIFAFGVIAATTLLTISTQVRNINRARPADIMRIE